MNAVNGDALVDFMAQHLPIAAALGIEVKHYDGSQLVLAAPLAPNINDKLSAFGGSLYSVSVMACWGMVYLQALNNGLTAPNIAVGKADIRYRAPVKDDFEVCCRVENQRVFDKLIQEYWQQGKAKISLSSCITAKNDLDFKIVELHGQFAIFD